ncbi:MAG: hypothetical protein DCC67_16360 [Planctomycetota bacterium]|nr:MAG: hypothetical protein DCC67_16360 [Planctomycetota bacterium]
MMNVFRALAPLRKLVWRSAAAAMILGGQACRAQEAPAVKAAPAADAADESAQYTVETIAAALDNPYAIALRPSTATSGPQELYVSESGAGRVVRLTTEKPGELTPVVTGIPVQPLGDKPDYRLGPMGLAFITPAKLAVGTGGLGLGKDVVRVYALPADGSPLAFDAADHAVGPLAPGSRSRTGQGLFMSLASIEDQVEKALFAASAGDPDEGWVLKAKLTANRVTDLQPFIATRRLTGAPSPSAVAINPKPRSHYLLIAQAGERSGERDSTLGFYGPATGALAMHVQTGLYDISALAYSPSGELYATDFSWNDATAGGVYRFDAAEVDGLQSCRPVKIAEVRRPTGLAFTPDGALWVTAFGDGDEPSAPRGALLKITAKPSEPRL